MVRQKHNEDERHAIKVPRVEVCADRGASARVGRY
jgi:hypothetical protein